MIKQRQRGYMLVAVLGVLCVMFTLAMALHYMSGSAHASYMLAEAQLEMEQGVQEQNAMKGTKLQQTAVPPAGQGLEISIGESGDSREDAVPKNYGTDLGGKKPFPWHAGYYDAAAMKALGNYSAPPWHSVLGWTPSTWRADLRTFGKRRYVSVLSAAFAYGAYAPEGTITLTQATAWTNPLLTEKVDDAVGAASGVPVVLGARGNIIVSDAFQYGEAYSLSGTINLPKGSGVVANYGTIPIAPNGADVYATRLVAGIDAAIATFDGATAAGNKTAALNQGVDVTAAINLLKGNSALSANFSLRNAARFPLPMLPSMTEKKPEYDLIFHVPYAPDEVGGAKNDGGKFPVIDGQGYAGAIPNANGQALSSLTASLGTDLDLATSALTGLAPGSDDGPTNRVSEASETLTGLSEEGYHFYAFAHIYKTLWPSLPSTVQQLSSGGKLDDLMSQVHHDVRLVHFGRPDGAAGFTWNADGSAVVGATLNVPRGRTLRVDGNLQVKGDVWVQRGAVLYVGGNLTVSPASSYTPDDPMAPSGRLLLEEGATVVVSGDFACAGSQRYGSIVTCGPMGRVQPITSALLVRGTVYVPYGVQSGAVADEMSGDAKLQNALDGQAPNAAKIDGPFHRRMPYFASFASVITTFSPMPSVGFVAYPNTNQTPNAQIPIFRTLSAIYAAAMNCVWGENFYTHSDWWIFGDGCAPVVPKIDAETAKAALVGVSSAFPNFSASVAGLVGPAVNGMVVDGTKTLMPKISQQIVLAALSPLPYGTFVTPAMKSAMDQVTTSTTSRIDALAATAQTATGGFDLSSANTSPVDTFKSAVNGGMDAGMLRECAGVLIYGQSSVSIGTAAPCPVAVGMFVSGGDLTVQTDVVVGSLLSAHGRINAKRLLYYPYFTHASLPVPKEPAFDGDPVKKGVEQTKYGPAMDPASTVEIGPATQHQSAGGWDR